MVVVLQVILVLAAIGRAQPESPLAEVVGAHPLVDLAVAVKASNINTQSVGFKQNSTDYSTE